MANNTSTSTGVTNLAVLRGEIVGDPVERTLPAGTTVVQFDVSTDTDGAPEATGAVACRSRVTVPVSWHDPATKALDALRVGSEVLVIGIVRRRFFRVGGATQSRTEVVAAEVIALRRRRAVESALARLADALS